MSAMNGLSTHQWWAEVRNEAQVVRTEASKQSLQPRDGALYFISLKNRREQTTAGKISEIADPKLYGQRVLDGSHRLASDEEIATYLAGEREKAESIRTQQQSVDAKRVIYISVPPPAAPPVRG